jgi:hypothetical protein
LILLHNFFAKDVCGKKLHDNNQLLEKKNVLPTFENENKIRQRAILGLSKIDFFNKNFAPPCGFLAVKGAACKFHFHTWDLFFGLSLT